MFITIHTPISSVNKNICINKQYIIVLYKINKSQLLSSVYPECMDENLQYEQVHK